jgi:hypothetical protein
MVLQEKNKSKINDLSTFILLLDYKIIRLQQQPYHYNVHIQGKHDGAFSSHGIEGILPSQEQSISN